LSLHRHPHQGEDIELVRGYRREVVWPREHDPNLSPAVGEIAGRDQASTAVATGACQHRHPGWREAGYGQLGQIAPGILHHLDQLDVKIFDHGPVDLSHLVRGQRGQLGSSDDPLPSPGAGPSHDVAPRSAT
jgi:hypothetical protein